MNKDEILEQAKKENLFNDEAKNNKSKKGNEWGIIAVLGVMIVFLFSNYINDKDTSQIFAIFGAYVGFKSLGEYFSNKEKLDLLSAIGGLLLFAGSFLLGIINIWNL